jgi:hypothetical protein
MKVKRVASEAQKLARERNWSKGQVLCIKSIANNIKGAKTTQLSERLVLSDMIYKLDKIIQNWNK